jgi:hypothetical protein
MGAKQQLAPQWASLFAWERIIKFMVNVNASFGFFRARASVET